MNHQQKSNKDIKEPEFDFLKARFNGSDYNPKSDNIRLTGQIQRVYNCMKDGNWRTFEEIQAITNDPQPSISAQLRHLRKKRFGSYIIEKRNRGDRERGLFEYRLLPPKREELFE